MITLYIYINTYMCINEGLQWYRIGVLMALLMIWGVPLSCSYIHTYIHAYIHIYISLYLYIYTSIYLYIYNIYISISISTYIYIISTYLFISLYLYIYTSIYSHLCIFTFMYVHIL